MSKLDPNEIQATAADRRDITNQNQLRRSIFSVPVTVTVSVGKRRLSVAEILELKQDTIVPLSARIDDPVDLTVDNKLIARGELVESDDGGLAVRVTEIMEYAHD